MGNSLGGMESYIRLGEEFPQFSGNGIVFANGSEKPAMQEVRYWHSSPEERKRHDEANRKKAEEKRVLPKKKSVPLKITHGDGAMGVRGADFEVLFSYGEGGPSSIVSGGREWLWRAPRPAYWRAPTENDFGNKFAYKSSVWSAADIYQTCENTEILSESESCVTVRFIYTSPAIEILKTDITYTLTADGTMQVKVHYHGQNGLPPFPLLGFRFATPVPVETVEWLDLSSETYPDRKKGGVFGWHKECPHIPAYLVPQECSCHTDTQNVTLHMADGKLLSFEAEDKDFAFSAIPYTPQQLEQAFHMEELPAPVRTVVTVCGAMRGVGGIDSWGSDVEKPYRISAEDDVEFSVRFLL